MSERAKDLDALRAEIDALDEELLRLINQRATLAMKVGQAKRDGDDTPIYYRPEREAAILRRIHHTNPGPLASRESARLMREIMSACLALECPLRVAYLGPEGTYTHQATMKHFGGSVETVPLSTIEEVMREVESGSVSHAVVPVENSLEGGVNQTLDYLRESPLKICGEVLLPIHHQLLSKAPTLDAVERVYAHAQALAQCRRWLATHLPRIEAIAVNSNAEGARRVVVETDSAAIAGQIAADLYELPVLYHHIEDDPGNTTRFLVFADHSPPPSGADVTSVMFTTVNQPGALHRVLDELAEANISMTRIESRPLRQEGWNYLFFVDIDGHIDTDTVRLALERVNDKALIMKILGSYPRAVL